MGTRRLSLLCLIVALAAAAPPTAQTSLADLSSFLPPPYSFLFSAPVEPPSPPSDVLVVGIVALRNEQASAAPMLCALAPFVHATVVLDDDSEDGTAAAAAAACKVVAVIGKPKGWWRVGAREETQDRNALLLASRRLRATHLVALDGDEVLSHVLLQQDYWWLLLKQLQVGQTLAVPWLRVWKGGGSVRVDSLYDETGAYAPARGGGQRVKGFAWADDGSSMYSGDFIHTSRSPMTGSIAVLDDVRMGLLHLQFVHWHDFVLKQVWYKMIEAQRGVMPVAGIALKYRFSLDFTHERVLPLHPDMTSACARCWAAMLQQQRRDAASQADRALNWRLQPLVQWLSEPPVSSSLVEWAPVVTGAVDDIMRNQLLLGAGVSEASCPLQPQLRVLFLAPAFSDTGTAAGSDSEADDACASWDFEPLLRSMVQLAAQGRGGGGEGDSSESARVSFHIMTAAADGARGCPAFAAWVAALQLQRARLPVRLHVHVCSCGSLCSVPAQLRCSSDFITNGSSSDGAAAVALLPFEFYR
jgi:hypothetical protein